MIPFGHVQLDGKHGRIILVCVGRCAAQRRESACRWSGSIELYDPKSETFTLTKGRIGVANAVPFLDGRVFVGDSTVAEI